MACITKHLKTLCTRLGAEYRVCWFDLEWVIYRDFGNGYEVEISNVNHNSDKRLATLYFWKDKLRVEKAYSIEQSEIERTISLFLRELGGDE